MKAMVLAAGLGTRLRPLTDIIAKPAIPIGRKSLIEWSLLHLASQGVREAVVNLHHKPETIRARLGDGHHLGLRIHYSEEPEILGTAGGLAHAARYFQDDEVFIMVNGDSLFEFDLREPVRRHEASGAIATMLLMPPHGGFSGVEMEDGWVRRISGRPPSAPGAAEYMFTGVHIMSRRLFDFLPQGVSGINRDVYPGLIQRGERVGGLVVGGNWFEFGDPASYLRNARLFLRSRGMDPAAEFLVVQSDIDPDSSVVDSIVWGGVRIRGGARIERCILTEGVCVEGGAHLDQVITRDGAFPL